MDRIRDSFARQGLMATLGARIVEIAPGRVRIEAEVTATNSQQQGAGHAGLTFALADSAAGYAALTGMEDGQEVVTSEFRISLLAPARGLLVAEGRIVRPGTPADRGRRRCAWGRRRACRDRARDDGAGPRGIGCLSRLPKPPTALAPTDGPGASPRTPGIFEKRRRGRGSGARSGWV